MRRLRGPGLDCCDRCGAVAIRLVVLPDESNVLACRDCLVPLYIALTVAAVNEGVRHG